MHGLILSGGGALGAYEAAAAAVVYRHFEDTEHPVSLVSGTSVGALNAAALTYGGPDFMESIWRRIRRRDVYSRGPLGPVSALLRVLSGRSLYSTAPLRRLIETEMDDPDRLVHSKIRLQVHATDLMTRRQLTWGNGSPHLYDGILA